MFQAHKTNQVSSVFSINEQVNWIKGEESTHWVRASLNLVLEVVVSLSIQLNDDKKFFSNRLATCELQKTSKSAVIFAMRKLFKFHVGILIEIYLRSMYYELNP